MLKKKFITIIRRGYRKFKKKNLIGNYYNTLLDIEIYCSKDISNNKKKYFDIKFCFNQYLIFSLLSDRLKLFYLICLGLNFKLIFPIPFHLNKYFKNNNINVFFVLSNTLFLIYSIIILFKNFINNLISLFNKYEKKFNINYDVIINLHNKNYLANKNNKNYNFVDYLKKEFYIKDNIIHDLKETDTNSVNYNYIYSKDFFPLKYSEKIFLFFYSIYLFFLSFILIFFLNFKYAILFKELINLKKISIFQKNNNLASKYFFYLNSGAFRPLWTYFAEKSGSEIIYINYGSGFFGFKNIITNEYPKVNLITGLYIMNWPKYVVDKILFYNFLRKLHLNMSIYLSKNQIHTSDSGSILPKFDSSKYTISVFDISPIRNFSRLLQLPQDEFRETSLCIKFIRDIETIGKKFNINILYKKKRKITSRDCKRYANLTKNLNMINVDPGISSERLSKISNLIISTPFTTAAFNYNKFNKINSIFYSPLNLISKNDRGSQGLPIVCGFIELENFIKKELKLIK